MQPTPPSRGLDVRPGQHWLVGGITGCGKTTFVRQLVQWWQAMHRQPALYIDSKGGEFPNVAGALYVATQEPPNWPPPPEYTSIVWSPPLDREESYDALFERILKARVPSVIVVDELSSLGGKSGQSFAVNFQRLLKQGRALGITCVVLTQELAYIPRQVLYQTTHLVLMLFDPDSFDGRRAGQLSGLPAVDVPYAFNYRNRQMPLLRWRYRDYKQLFGLVRAGVRATNKRAAQRPGKGRKGGKRS